MSHSRPGADLGENVRVNPDLLTFRSAGRRARRRPRSSRRASLGLCAAPAVLAHGGQVPDGSARRLRACCSAGRAIRWCGCRRSSRSSCGGPACGGSTGRTRRTRCRGRGPGRGSRACWRSCSRWTRGSSATTRRCSGSTWSSTCCSPWWRRSCCCTRDRSRCCCAPRPRRPAGAGSSRSSTRGWCGSSRSPSCPGCCSRPSCGRATSRRCSTPPSRTSGSTGWSTRCSWVPRCCSGGRSWVRTRRRGG